METLDQYILHNASGISSTLKIISIVITILATIISFIIIDQKRKKSYKEFLDERDRQQRDFGKFH
jgi:uncharacterized membrane protein (DUF106 family)